MLYHLLGLLINSSLSLYIQEKQHVHLHCSLLIHFVMPHNILGLQTLMLEDARFIFYEDERERIATSVSTYDMQRQSKEDKLSSNKAVKSSRLYTEHTKSYHKTILTRTFQHMMFCTVYLTCLGYYLSI